MAQKQGHGPDDFWKILPSQTSGHMLTSCRTCLSPCSRARRGSKESLLLPAALVKTAVCFWDGRFASRMYQAHSEAGPLQDVSCYLHSIAVGLT